MAQAASQYSWAGQLEGGGQLVALCFISHARLPRVVKVQHAAKHTGLGWSTHRCTCACRLYAALCRLTGGNQGAGAGAQPGLQGRHPREVCRESGKGRWICQWCKYTMGRFRIASDVRLVNRDMVQPAGQLRWQGIGRP